VDEFTPRRQIWRISALSHSCKWEAIAHGANAFLIGIASIDDLSRIDGMQMGVPNFKAQIAVSTW
jgi:hypothetical protein